MNSFMAQVSIKAKLFHCESHWAAIIYIFLVQKQIDVTPI